MPWKRPIDVPIQTWSSFRGRDRDGRPARHYEIRDIDEKERDRCIDFLTETFLRDEPLCQALGILSDPDSVATIRANWRGYLAQGVSLACYATDEGDDDDDDELVAVALCVVSCVDDDVAVDFDKIKEEPWKRLLRTLLTIEEAYNVFKRHSVDKFFCINVLAVARAHRGNRIGEEVLRASEALSRALDLTFQSATLTAVESQALAARCGYTTLATVPYGDMASRGVDLSSCTTKSAVVMGKELR